MHKYVNCDIVFQEVPDEVSLAINISNCPNNCPGCHSSYLMDDIGDPLTHESLQTLISSYESEITCVCFMGGDADPDGIDELAQWVQNQYQGKLKVGWYTGKEKLPDNFCPSHFNYVKVGPYKKGFGPLKEKTTNQRMYRIENNELVDITSRFWRK